MLSIMLTGLRILIRMQASFDHVLTGLSVNNKNIGISSQLRDEYEYTSKEIGEMFKILELMKLYQE